jgi:glutathione S-transferase
VKPQLWFLPISPWSLKARAALRLRSVTVEERPYVPLLGEPLLRAKLRDFSGTLTVPVLFTERGALRDSWDIARYAEQAGSGPALFPAAQLGEIEAWNQRSERLLSAGRTCAMLRVVNSPEAALETLPKAMRGLLGTSGARMTVGVFNRKYGIRPRDEAPARAALRAELSALSAALADGREYLLGALSYADLTMALALQLVKPLPDSPMGPVSLRAATDQALADEFAPLFVYRDRLHARHGLLPV